MTSCLERSPPRNPIDASIAQFFVLRQQGIILSRSPRTLIEDGAHNAIVQSIAAPRLPCFADLACHLFACNGSKPILVV